MQKVTDFLEQNVQWVAVALGVLWLLFMTYAYVLTPPAAVEIGNETLTAGEVDEFTLEQVAMPLKREMEPGKGTPDMSVPDFTQTFLARMNTTDAPAVRLAGAFNTRTGEIKIEDLPQPDGTRTAVANGENPASATPGAATIPDIDHLKPTVADARVGRTTIVPFGMQVPAQAVAQVPGMDPMQAQPIEGAVDKDWVTQSFEINMRDLRQAFESAQVPPIARTAFLQVEMVRQERLPNGEWGADGQVGAEAVVPPIDRTLGNAAQLAAAPGMQRPQFPAGEAGRAPELTYLAWATANPTEILQPGFFQRVKGDPWQRPGEEVQTVVFNPATHVGPKGNLTDEQWQEVLAYRREQQRLKEEQQRQNRRTPTRGGPMGPGGDFGDMPDMGDMGPRGPRGGGGGGRRGGGGGYPAVKDPDRPAFYQARQPNRPPAGARPPGAPPYGPPGGMNPYGPSGPYGPGGMGPYGPGYDPSMEGMYPEDMGMGMMPQGPVEGTSGQPGVDFPAGEFHPAEWVNSEAIDVWAHDDTVAPGKTYRYRARYKIKNPLYMIQNIAKDPKDSDVFALVSDWSEWSEQVSVPRLTNFFVVSRPLQGRDTVRFDVFRWQDGIQQKESFDVGPGDAIGREMAGVDFGTGWRLVDVRPDAKGSDTVAILVNDDGEIERRSFQSDQKDALYQKLKTEADAAKAITASANAR